MSDLGSILGEQIERRRELIGLSASQFARLAGLHPDTVRRIERGEGNPKLSSLGLLAEGLKTEPWRLLKGREPEEGGGRGGERGEEPAAREVEMVEEALDRASLKAGKDSKLRRRLIRTLIRSLQFLMEMDWRGLSETERRFLNLLEREGGEVEGTAKELAAMIGKSPRSFWYAVTALEGSWIAITHQRGKGQGCSYRLLRMGLGSLEVEVE